MIPMTEQDITLPETDWESLITILTAVEQYAQEDDLKDEVTRLKQEIRQQME